MRIGILYPGGLGATLGKAIVQLGGTVITCLDGRSNATRDRTAGAGIVVVPSLEELVRKSELIISLVPPDAAATVANSIARCRTGDPPANNTTTPPIYIEANSISPQGKRCIAQTLAHAGISCIDGAFFGPTNSVCRDNVLVVSGPRVGRIAPFLGEVLEVRSIGRR